MILTKPEPDKAKHSPFEGMFGAATSCATMNTPVPMDCDHFESLYISPFECAVIAIAYEDVAVDGEQ